MFRSLHFEDLGSEYVLGDVATVESLARRSSRTPASHFQRVPAHEARRVLAFAAHRLRCELRGLLVELRTSADWWSDQELESYIVREVGSIGGRLRLARRPRAAMRFIPASAHEPAPPPPAPEEMLAWLELDVLDEAGEPIADTRFEVTFASGAVHSGTTDGAGYARIDATSERGAAQVSFPDLEREYLVERGA